MEMNVYFMPHVDIVHQFQSWEPFYKTAILAKESVNSSARICSLYNIYRTTVSASLIITYPLSHLHASPVNPPSDREISLVICIFYNRRKLENKKVNWQDSFTFLAHFKKNYLFILAALSLHCCLWIFSRFSNQELFSNCDEQASRWAKILPAMQETWV